jgi:hypothetical protein
MFYGLVSTRLDFSDEMETLKVELKKAGKLDDAPKAVASRNRAGLTNCHGLMTLLLLIGNWSQFVPEFLHGNFQVLCETCAASQRPLHIHRQGIAQKDPAGTLDARQGIQSAARRSSEVLQCCGHSSETEDLRHCGYTATLFDVFYRVKNGCLNSMIRVTSKPSLFSFF